MTKYLPINEIVRSVSVTHKFDKPYLIFLNTSDIEDGKIINRNFLPVNELKGQAKKTVKQDDILFSEIRPKNKRFAYIDFTDTEDYVVSTKLMVLRNINPDVDNKYFYYYLTSKYMLETLQSRAENRICSFPQITFDLLSDYKVRVPGLEVQKRIARILSSIDSKIEINNRINAQLEMFLKTLFDYWFVQFDFPNEEGKPYKSCGGKMIWNEYVKRDIPVGWKVESIEKCCSVIDCLHAKKPDYKFEDEIYFLLQLENIRDDGLLDLTNKYYVTKKDYEFWTSRILVSEDDLIVTNAGRVAATAQIPKGIKTGIGRNITAIRPNSINPTYLFWAFQGWDMKRQIKWNTDAGAFFSSLNVKGIRKLFVVRPRSDIENRFEEIAKPMRQQRETNNAESHNLTELRDWLLPMLMNGQVVVENGSND